MNGQLSHLLTRMKAGRLLSQIRLFSSVRQRDPGFYSDEAIKRRYYYVVDTRGQLFLEDTKHRNIATCLKDNKFLKFFYSQLQKTPEHLVSIADDDIDRSPYRYVSFCGKEINFVCPDDHASCLVFSEIVTSNDPRTGLERDYLLYAGDTMKQSFYPNLLRISEVGRLYHPTVDHKKLPHDMGLLHPHLAQSLDLRMTSLETFTVHYKGTEYPINSLEIGPK